MVIPAFEEYDVLNLAQAVNIIAYEFWQRKLELETEASRCNKCIVVVVVVVVIKVVVVVVAVVVVVVVAVVLVLLLQQL